MAEPEIAIITPTLNSGATLRASIESVIRQRHRPREYIIIDGGSTDQTHAIVHGYAGLPYLRLVSERGGGIYGAMNLGIQESSAEWLYFLGSDDVLHDVNVLADVARGFEQADLVYGNVVWLGSGAIYDGRFDIEKLLYRNICHQAVFYQRRLFRRLGNFETRYRHLADYCFNIKCFAADIRIRYIDRVIAIFNDQGASGHDRGEQYLRDLATIIRRHFPRSVAEERCKQVLHKTYVNQLCAISAGSGFLETIPKTLRVLWESGDLRLARDAQYLLRKRVAAAFARSWP